MLQAMKEEPPLNAKCKDKFLIQTMLIPEEKATLPLHDLVRLLLRKLTCYLTRGFLPQWNTPEGEEPGKVHSQKVKVNYLPPEGQPLEEEDEFPHRTSMMSGIAPDDAVSRRASSLSLSASNFLPLALVRHRQRAQGKTEHIWAPR